MKQSIKVFITNIDDFNNIELNKYIKNLSVYLQRDISRYKRYEDRLRSLLGKLLLQKIIDMLQLNITLHDMKYNEFKKPYFESEFCFNISHSNKYVVCAISYEDVGIDIEEIKEINLNDFKSVIDKSELEQIENSKDKYREFYKVWTAKEALLKLEGKGFFEEEKVTLLDNKLFFKEKEYWYETFDYDNYLFYISSKKKKKIETVYLNSNDILNISTR